MAIENDRIFYYPYLALINESGTSKGLNFCFLPPGSGATSSL